MKMILRIFWFKISIKSYGFSYVYKPFKKKYMVKRRRIKNITVTKSKVIMTIKLKH